MAAPSILLVPCYHVTNPADDPWGIRDWDWQNVTMRVGPAPSTLSLCPGREQLGRNLGQSKVAASRVHERKVLRPFPPQGRPCPPPRDAAYILRQMVGHRGGVTLESRMRRKAIIRSAMR